MKSVFWALILTLSATAAANPNIQTAEYYELNDWIGEYPIGYQILSDTEVQGVQSPTNPVPNLLCTLRKDAVIHPWAQKTESEFIYLSPIERYVAKKDFEIYSNETTNIQVNAGDEVVKLSYLSEGICLLSANGQVGEDGCFGEEDDRATLTSVSVFSPKYFFRTECMEGHSTWIDAALLESIVVSEEATVKYAEILDYGTVNEP